MSQLNNLLTTCERILNTPLPIAYSIAISQITWVYVFLLPFQLLSSLSWVTIPATMFASYIILGLLFIGREIEDPFGHDVNDLPLDLFCQQIVQDIEVIAARPKARMSDYIESSRNKVLFPHSTANYYTWTERPEKVLRTALRNRPHAYFDYSMGHNGESSPERRPQEKGDNNV
jgi:ion channel-forming bestrophin family protein